MAVKELARVLVLVLPVMVKMPPSPCLILLSPGVAGFSWVLV